jgi:prophage antirepressor-like protein
VDREGNPWFVLADVCRVLGHSNPSVAGGRLDDDEKDTLNITEGIRGPGNPNITVVNESGLYSLILTSRKDSAKRFKPSVMAPQYKRFGRVNDRQRRMSLAVAIYPCP